MAEQSGATHDPFGTSLAGRRLGRYEVLARLASGGMAGVYVARAIGVAGFERLFAIKALHPHLAHEEEFITMFLDEARLAARIRHPNVVPTIDISDTQDAGYYLVMDYIEGDHLGAVLQQAAKHGDRLPAPVSLRIVIDALDGLAAAHDLIDENGVRLNLVHRDISPHNIMVSTDGIARITDFGVAKAEVRLSTTREGQFKGKLAYMAPEHASSGETDQRSDLFSMGIILWECLTGRRLFRAENHAATLNKICLEPIPAPSAADPALAPFDEILSRALARNPDERYKTATEFAEDIEAKAAELGGIGHPRIVAKLVKKLAAEKLASDKELIRSGIAAIAHTPQVAEPRGSRVVAAPVAEQPPPAQLPTPVPPDPATMASPVHVASVPARASRRGMIIGAVAMAIAAGTGLAVILMDEGEQRVTTSPLEGGAPTAAQPPPTPLPAPTPAPVEPAPTVQPEPEAATAEVSPEPTEAEEPEEAAQPKTPRKTRKSARAEPRVKSSDPASKTPIAAKASKPDSEAKPKAAKAKPKASKNSVDDLIFNPYR